MIPYPISVAKDMQLFYLTLSEKERRQYAAIEAVKFGYGGISYISGLLGISRDTINEGKKEIKSIALSGRLPDGRQRAAGGGRKKKLK
jgi:hypothetical protein